jgi:DNA-dependent protein kinase catalytic subunit
MPLFAKYLHSEFQAPETHLNVKIFILKIISNNAKLFKPFADKWFEPICQYVILKDNGGKGFHYFLRDLCTMLISWNYVPVNPDDSSKLLMTKMVNSLILIAADEVKLIFK